MESGGGMQYEQRAVLKFIVAEKRISGEYPQTSLQWLWKSYGRQKHRWSLGEKSDGSRKFEADEDVIRAVRAWIGEQDKAHTHLFLVGARL
jgi:hypothetical protein